MAARELAYRGIGGLPVTGLGDDGRAGGKRLAAADFLRGFELPAGSRLESAAAPAKP